MVGRRSRLATAVALAKKWKKQLAPVGLAMVKATASNLAWLHRMPGPCYLSSSAGV
jgi:hypothetical protein